MKTLEEIESGSRDIEGLERITAVFAARFTALGAKVEMIEQGDDGGKHDAPERTIMDVSSGKAPIGQ